MIIGKNTNMQNHNNFINNQTNNNPSTNSTPNRFNPMMENNRTMQHTNVMSKKEMNDKAFSMLQDRLNKGLITMDEFNKKCAKLGKIK